MENNSMSIKSIYPSLREWAKACQKEYKVARQRGMLPKICKTIGWELVRLTKSKPNGYWTKEMCIEDAKKYKTKTEWAKNSKRYEIARRYGWLKDCCSFMNKLKEIKNKLKNLKRAQEKERKDLEKKHKREIKNLTQGNKYERERKNFAQKINSKKPHGYWTKKENCINDAKTCASRKKWARKSPGAYMSAYKNGWLDECCVDMKIYNEPLHFWSKERCREQALKYNSETAWSEKSKSSYSAASAHGWIRELCGHMISNNEIKLDI